MDMSPLTYAERLFTRRRRKDARKRGEKKGKGSLHLQTSLLLKKGKKGGRTNPEGGKKKRGEQDV